MLCKAAAKNEDFTFKDATLFPCPHFPARILESRPKLALAHGGYCLTSAIQDTPNSSCLLLHLWCKSLFLLGNAQPNLISAYRSQPARQPQCLLSACDQWRSLHGKHSKIHRSPTKRRWYEEGRHFRQTEQNRGRFQFVAVYLQSNRTVRKISLLKMRIIPSWMLCHVRGDVFLTESH